MNGKYGGGGMPFAPAAFMNDGLFDVTFYKQPTLTASGFIGVFNSVTLKSGMHAYRDDWAHIRGNKIIIENLNYITPKIHESTE